ncbi:unnamed protein product, partial [marine sediment metagenome]
AEAFFENLKKPFELDSAAKIAFSPFAIIGLCLAMFGCVMIVIAILVGLVYHDMRAFWLDLIVGVLMTLLGVGLRLGSLKKNKKS